MGMLLIVHDRAPPLSRVQSQEQAERELRVVRGSHVRQTKEGSMSFGFLTESALLPAKSKVRSHEWESETFWNK